MSAYVLILLYGLSMMSIDYESKSQCELSGSQFEMTIEDASFICLERR